MPKTKSRQDKARENARAKDPEYDGKRALAEKQRREAKKKLKAEAAAAELTAAELHTVRNSF